MLVAGLMSGTSADGLDIAIVRITPNPLKLKLLSHDSYAYPKPLRAAVLNAMDSQSTSAAELARLHWRLGEFAAESLSQTIAKQKQKPQLAGTHGQTIYHQSTAKPYLGKDLRCTWQLGEPSLIAARNHIPVVSDFRPADMAAGGQGAPLVPMLDYTLFAHKRDNRILLNLGGIANLTAIPANSAQEKLIAFDTGPANMVIDALMQRLYSKPFDRNGAIAKRGTPLQSVLNTLLEDPYYAAPPPKSTGREQYGEAFVTRLLKLCGKARPEDIISTATALTAQTIYTAYQRHVWPHLAITAPLARATDLIAAGGGTQNQTLMRMLSTLFEPLGIRVTTTDTHSLPSQAKEAAAFALLAYLTWHNQPGNIPAATGAIHPAILGKITHA